MPRETATLARATAFEHAAEPTLEAITFACDRLPSTVEANLSPFFDQIFSKELNEISASKFQPATVLATTLGCRPWDFAVTCRLEVAHRLFQQTDFKIFEVARLVGFRSERLRLYVRQRFGLSAGEWRNLIRGPADLVENLGRLITQLEAFSAGQIDAHFDANTDAPMNRAAELQAVCASVASEELSEARSRLLRICPGMPRTNDVLP
jgi:AraC-like DNA-binding protein